MKDACSTGNMCKHARKCWDNEVLAAVDEAKNAASAHAMVVEPFKQNGSITKAFKQKGQGMVTYSHRQHTQTQTK